MCWRSAGAVQDASDGVGVGDDLDDAHARAQVAYPPLSRQV
jgi:hypothetical protein